MLHSEYVGQEGSQLGLSEASAEVAEEQLNMTSDDRHNEVSSSEKRPFNIFRELEYLQDLVNSGTHIPLTELVLLDRPTLLNRLEIIKQNLPAQLATAIEITDRQAEIIRQTEMYVNRLVSSAEEKAAAAIRESTLVRQAELAAAKLKLKTERECEQLRQMATAESEEIIAGADGYADSVLGNIEQQLSQMLGVIQNGRQQLNQDKDK